MACMKMQELFKKGTVPMVLACVILALMAYLSVRDTRALLRRDSDEPPTIEFTWTPAGAVDLKEMRGFLKIADDHSLDFTTYRLTIEELKKTVDLPIEGLIGKEYEQQVSFGLIADDPRLVGKDKITVTITIADDRGQKSEITRVISLKR